jgi:hypothetical protein
VATSDRTQQNRVLAEVQRGLRQSLLDGKQWRVGEAPAVVEESKGGKGGKGKKSGGSGGNKGGGRRIKH